MQVGIIGYGRVGKALYYAITNAGVDVAAVLVKKRKNYVKAPLLFYDDLTVQQKDIPIWIIATPDDAIKEVISKYDFLKGKQIFHLSGSVPSSIFRAITNDYGVFYPLHSFNDSKVEFGEIPVFLTASSEVMLDILIFIAEKLGCNYRIITDNQRQYIHLAAVFVNNFTNHLYYIANQILKEQQLDFDILHHIIKNHVETILRQNPGAIQTGPAIRNDKKTMEKHLNLLKGNKDWQNVYKFVSQSIINSNKTENENR